MPRYPGNCLGSKQEDVRSSAAHTILYRKHQTLCLGCLLSVMDVCSRSQRIYGQINSGTRSLPGAGTINTHSRLLFSNYRRVQSPYTKIGAGHQIRPYVPSIDAVDMFEEGLVHSAAVNFSDGSGPRLKRRATLIWQQGQPKKVLIVKKVNNHPAAMKLHEIGEWLVQRGKEVYVEKVVQEKEFPQFKAFNSSTDDVDMCITLGGDGTVLYLSSLFEKDVPLPPLLCFAMGTLGFLTPFDAERFHQVLTRVFDETSSIYCTLRCRKRCEVHAHGQVVAVHHVLNECVIDRGSFPGAIDLDLLVDGELVTSVQVDGLIIATPSGSTAYSMSAGGPMVAPSVPCTLLTPIAPLSLSFRPLIVPESSGIEIVLPECSRAHARASFDGRHTSRIQRSGSIVLTTSRFPMPFINMKALDSDWYEGITQKLKWNQTIREPLCERTRDEGSPDDHDSALSCPFV